MTASVPSLTEDREAIERIITGFRAGMLELRCISSQRMLRLGVSMTNYHVLSMLERHGEMTMSRLAEMLDVSLSNVTGIVDRMEERGLIERGRVPDDRRVVLARITPRGRQLLAEVEVLHKDMFGRALGRLDEAQLQRIARAMEDLRGAVSAALAEEPDLLPLAHDHAHHRPQAAPVGDVEPR